MVVQHMSVVPLSRGRHRQLDDVGDGEHGSK